MGLAAGARGVENGGTPARRGTAEPAGGSRAWLTSRGARVRSHRRRRWPGPRTPPRPTPAVRRQPGGGSVPSGMARCGGPRAHRPGCCAEVDQTPARTALTTSQSVLQNHLWGSGGDPWVTGRPTASSPRERVESGSFRSQTSPKRWFPRAGTTRLTHSLGGSSPRSWASPRQASRSSSGPLGTEGSSLKSGTGNHERQDDPGLKGRAGVVTLVDHPASDRTRRNDPSEHVGDCSRTVPGRKQSPGRERTGDCRQGARLEGVGSSCSLPASGVRKATRSGDVRVGRRHTPRDTAVLLLIGSGECVRIVRSD